MRDRLKGWWQAVKKPIKLIITSTIVVTFVFGIGYLIWLLPEILQEPTAQLPLGSRDLIEVRNELRKTIIQIFGGLIIIASIILTYRRIKASETTAVAAMEQVKIALDQNRISEEGQITERYTRAIDQLGSSKTEVILGGVFALERIARDSQTDHVTIMEILSAYLRGNFPYDYEYRPHRQLGAKSTIDEERGHRWRSKVGFMEDTIRNRTVLEAIVAIIGRRRWTEHGVDVGFKLDLSSVSLSPILINGLHLTNADFRRSDISGSYIYHSKMLSTQCQHSYLYQSRFYMTDLENSNFSRTNATETNFEDCSLKGTGFIEAKLVRATINKSNLEGADFLKADLSGANLVKCNLIGVRNLTLEQISKAKSVYDSNLEVNLRKKIEQNYPALLSSKKDLLKRL